MAEHLPWTKFDF